MSLPKSPDNQVLKNLPSGREGVRDTLSYMRAFADQYKMHPAVRTLALSLTRTLPQKDYVGEVRVLWDYVKNRVRYVRDIRGVETVQSPVKTLEYGQGDCDDKCTLLASLLESLGHPTRFRAVGFGPRSLCHVLVDVFDGKQWIALETTENVNLGWTPPGVTNEMIEGLGDLGANIFSKIGKVIKKAGRDLDDTVLQKGAKDILKNKAVGTIASAVSTVFPIALVVAVPSQLVQAHDTKVRAQERASKDAAQIAASLEPKRYVLDMMTQQVRLATPFDSGAQQYTVTEDGTVTPWSPPSLPLPGFMINSPAPETLSLRPQSPVRPSARQTVTSPVLLPAHSTLPAWVIPTGAVVLLGFLLSR